MSSIWLRGLYSEAIVGFKAICFQRFLLHWCNRSDLMITSVFTHKTCNNMAELGRHQPDANQFCTLWDADGYTHDDVIKWKHFARFWHLVRGIHRSPVNSPHEGKWCGALMFSLFSVWSNSWVNNWDANDLKCHCVHYDITIMIYPAESHCAIFNTDKKQ